MTETEIPKHRKKRSSKAYKIEMKGTCVLSRAFAPDWQTCKRYRTEKSRDEALVALKQRESHSRGFIFRAG